MDPEGSYRVHNIPLLVSILSQINPFHTLKSGSTLLRIISNASWLRQRQHVPLKCRYKITQRPIPEDDYLQGSRRILLLLIWVLA
jgi:hypothetical protein